MKIVEVFLNLLLNPITLTLLIIMAIIIRIFGKNIIGFVGEHWTKQVLDKLPKEDYVVINDVFIDVDNNTHQIDHVVVSKYGIFVIETKQYNGYITGDKYDKYWVRHFYKKKYYYLNPIRQNYGHIKSLASLLQIDESKLFNIVCIPSAAELEIKHDGELTRYDTIIDKITSYKDIIINNADDIINIINNANIKDKKIRKEHNKNIIRTKIDKDKNKCPRCGGDLIYRRGKYSSFYGCSNYPKCKYTRKNI